MRFAEHFTAFLQLNKFNITGAQLLSSKFLQKLADLDLHCLQWNQNVISKKQQYF